MANNYYNFSTPFIPGTKVRSEQVNTQLGGVESGFDLMPTDPASNILGTAWFGTDVQGATVNDYDITTSDPQSSLTNGQRIAFFATHTNTGPAAMDLDGLGANAMVNFSGSAFVGGEVISGQWYEFIWDNANTQFIVAAAVDNAINVGYAEEWANNAVGVLVSSAAGGDQVDDYSALHQAVSSENWAIRAEDDAIPVIFGGDGVTDFSAFHWAQKALAAAGGGVIVGTGVAVPTAGTPYDYDAQVEFQNANFLQTATIGWNGTSNFQVRSVAQEAVVELIGTDTGGVERTLFSGDPDGALTFRYAGALAGGFQVSAPDADHPFRLNPYDGASPSTDYFDYNDDDNEWTLQGDVTFRDGVGAGRAVFSVNIQANGLSPSTQAPFQIATNTNHGTTTAGHMYLASDAGADRGLFIGRGTFAQNLTDKGADQWGCTFDTGTSMAADPGTYNLRFDNATPASVTEISMDDLQVNGHDFGDYFGAELAIGDQLFIKQVNDDTKWILLTLTGVPVDATGWWTMTVSVTSSGVLPDDSAELNVKAYFASVAPSGFDPSANQTITGDWIFEGITNFNNPADDVDLESNVSIIMRNSADTSSTFLQNLGTTFQFGVAGGDFGSQLIDFGSSFLGVQIYRSLHLREQAAANADIASYGQFWVDNAAGHNPRFTDENGNDMNLKSNLYDASTTPIRRVQAAATGELQVFRDDSDDGSQCRIGFTHANGVVRAWIGVTGTGVNNWNSEAHGAGFSITGETAGGVAQNIFSATPGDNDTIIYSNGVSALVVRDDRIAVDSLALDVISSAPADTTGEIQIWGRDDPWFGAPWVTDENGDDYALGFGTARLAVTNATFNMNSSSQGYLALNGVGYYDDGANYTITLENSSGQNFPIRAAFQVLNAGSGTITINEGTSTTLFFMDGAGGAVTDTAGGCTIDIGAVVTVYRVSTTVYLIWGSAITP